MKVFQSFLSKIIIIIIIMIIINNAMIKPSLFSWLLNQIFINKQKLHLPKKIEKKKNTIMWGILYEI